ncbi:hypothetical protein DP107_03875 [Haloglomus irregulare]|mgnify:CR=1 FL=1|jgi:hypothetical protein|uniref:DUF8006 domain-containing protein n=1 Tax=Haloglomus irregulare TaxID=2234134 RepID=A0A554NC92_9EURY|nr:hypothetical protein [Haloglomus irregulare]TSD15011.1 hypothetical protein DP107_03875 [Haloglomus irregulare]
MLPLAPLQVIDNFLLQYNVGQVILALYVFTTLGALPLKSRKIIGLNTVAFGVLFLLTPTPGMQPVHFQFLGIALIFVGPFLFITGKQ